MLRSLVFVLGHFRVNAKNTLLDEQLCQVYYTGTGDCKELRSEIRAEVRGSQVPTLELGNPSAAPMMFWHGWPDTAAMWVNQFERFCLGQDAPFFCVAPSWVDFHPDFPRANESQLFWSVQIELFHSVVEDMKLKNVTFVTFDFGAEIGYQYVWQHPNVVKQLVAMDIGMETQPPVRPLPNEGDLASLPEYAQNNIKAFMTGDDQMMARNMAMMGNGSSPCIDCRIAPSARGVGALTGWPYYQLVRSRKGEAWIDRFATDIPLSEWKFDIVPFLPTTVPLLFLYSAEQKPYSSSFREWVNGRGDGSRCVEMLGADHWFQIRIANATNSEMERWLFPNAERRSLPDHENTVLFV